MVDLWYNWSVQKWIIASFFFVAGVSCGSALGKLPIKLATVAIVQMS